MTGHSVASELRAFAGAVPAPARGRYASRPARADESGVVEVPPPVPGRLPLMVAGALGCVVLLGLATRIRSIRS